MADKDYTRGEYGKLKTIINKGVNIMKLKNKGILALITVIGLVVTVGCGSNKEEYNKVES